LAETAQTHPACAGDRGTHVDVVVARPHRGAVNVRHTRHPARYAAAVATFLRYVKIQLVVFVFGIVGPIFLILFFASQPDPDMKWAYWSGLFITAADVLIALGLTASSGTGKKSD
jgi:hypothetical protein